MVQQDLQPVVLTVGHSTRSLEEFIDLLKAHSVTRLIDVRAVPRSRHNPQFNRDTSRTHWRSPASAMRTLPVWEASAAPARSPESGLAQRFVPRLRRLHADRRICTESGECHGTGKNAKSRVDVRRGRAVALSSLADRRRANSARNPRRGNHKRDTLPGARADAFCPSGRHCNHVSVCGCSGIR
jgi:hypothetical protein